MYNSLAILLFRFEHFLCSDDSILMEFDVFYFLTCPKLLFESIISHLFMHNISYEIVLGISRAYLVFSFCFLINDLNSCLLFQLGTYSIFQPSRFVMHHIPYLLANFCSIQSSDESACIC